jgi:hypothetical protein
LKVYRPTFPVSEDNNRILYGQYGVIAEIWHRINDANALFSIFVVEHSHYCGVWCVVALSHVDFFGAASRHSGAKYQVNFLHSRIKER